jgi:hypothetical protein
MSQHHHVEATVPVPTTDIVALLSEQPAIWLRRFLRLATVAAPAPLASNPARYRLRPPIGDGAGAFASSFTWRPNVDADIFERFTGRLVVQPAAAGSILVLDGDAIGGVHIRNANVLRALLALIVSAISARQPADA